ncbi:MAG: 50S ribosomal protein L25 [Bacteroidales bacterium]|nr:50S ribosomal protein L25 [Bacteroidales bacterium]
MQHFELNGQLRQVGNKATIKAFRRQGLVPCNLYGAGLENILFTVNAKDLKGLINTPYSHIVDLNLDGQKYTAILHELQFHPVEDLCLHVDFLSVSEDKPISISVPVKVSGHSKGVQLGGKFTQNARNIRVSGLMKDLPDDVTVDISGLGLDQKIKAGNLSFPGLQILTDKDAIICSVLATRNTAAAATEEAAE